MQAGASCLGYLRMLIYLAHGGTNSFCVALCAFHPKPKENILLHNVLDPQFLLDGVTFAISYRAPQRAVGRGNVGHCL